jgi:predicted ATPase
MIEAEEAAKEAEKNSLGEMFKKSQIGANLATAAMEKFAEKLVEFLQNVPEANARDEDPRLMIENREIRALRRAGGAVWFDFRTLCGGPRSQNDYLEIATMFKAFWTEKEVF